MFSCQHPAGSITRTEAHVRTGSHARALTERSQGADGTFVFLLNIQEKPLMSRFFKLAREHLHLAQNEMLLQGG